MLQKAVFSVPANTTQERLLDAVPDYITKFVQAREKDGWKLTSRVYFYPFPRLLEDGERKEYSIYAQFDRAPITRTIEVPDNLKLIQLLQRKYGAKLED